MPQNELMFDLSLLVFAQPPEPLQGDDGNSHTSLSNLTLSTTYFARFSEYFTMRNGKTTDTL